MSEHAKERLIESRATELAMQLYRAMPGADQSLSYVQGTEHWSFCTVVAVAIAEAEFKHVTAVEPD